MRKVASLLGLVSVFVLVCSAGSAVAAGANDPVLLGDQTVKPTSDNNSDGSAQAWSYTASTSGIATSVDFYVDSGNSGAVTLGLYSDSSGDPGQLLASASISSPTAGQWNQATFGTSANVTSGTTYWLAVLGTGGSAVDFRDNSSDSSCKTEISEQSNLSALPSSWTAGQSWSSYCPASFYASGTTASNGQNTPPSAPANTSPPSISGTAQQGDTLTAAPGSWSNSPTGYSYQWQDCKSSSSCSNISGATSASYTLQASDVGNSVDVVVTATNSVGNGQATGGSVGPVTSSGSSGGSFPLKVAAGGRYFETAGGAPFLMVGDSPQSLIGDNSESSADSYLADRAAHGFNTVWVNLLCDDYTFCASSGDTYDGVAPFTSGSGPGSYDLSTPNSVFFQRAHDIVAQAQADGLVVVLDPIETGGWLSTLENNGDGSVSSSDRDFRYGQFVGNEFKDLSNVVWMSGNDFQTFSSSSDSNDALSVARGIASTDPSALQTLELNYSCDNSASSASLDDASWSSILSANDAYTYSPTYADVLRAYDQSPAIPVFMGEANYEYEDNCNYDGGSSRNLRLQEWWTMTSGATGQLYGSKYTDRIANGWSASDIDSPGVTQLGYETSLLGSLAWYDLVPDQQHTFVTAGYGTAASTGDFASNDYVSAGLTPDGKLGLAYLPDPNGSLSTITVALGKMAGPVTARWYDPTNGQYTPVPGSPFTNTGSQTFTPPGTNSAGDSDWVLVLQAA